MPFVPADFEAASDILSLCIADPARELSEYIQNDSAEIFCVKKDGSLCGVLCLLLTEDTADLLDIAVSPDFRRQGIGQALVDFTQRLCKERGILSVMLEVRESNAPAVSLYEKCGFEKISVRKNYYKQPTENAIIYRRSI